MTAVLKVNLEGLSSLEGRRVGRDSSSIWRGELLRGGLQIVSVVFCRSGDRGSVASPRDECCGQHSPAHPRVWTQVSSKSCNHKGPLKTHCGKSSGL